MHKNTCFFCESCIIILLEERFDTYCWEKNKKLLTTNEHTYPGLLNISYRKTTHATEPITLHYHKDLIEFHFVVKGLREMMVEDVSYLTTANRVFIVYSNETHNSVEHFERPVEFYTFQLNLKSRDSLLGLNQESSNQLYDLLTGSNNRMCALSKEDMHNLKVSMDKLLANKTEQHCSALVTLAMLLFKIPQLSDVTVKADENTNENISKALRFIDENFKEALTVKDMAEYCGYSQSHFQTHFKSIYGVSPSEYLNTLRIEHAKKLLSNSDIDITAIAFELNFSSSNYFSTFFKRYTNTTPSLYRQSMLNKNSNKG